LPVGHSALHGRPASLYYSAPDRTLQVFPDIESMESHLPSEVIDALKRALNTPAVEDLDI
jgi:EXLDI family protein